MPNQREKNKWLPFQSMIHIKEIEKELTEKRARCSKPILSEDITYENEQNILEAYHTKTPLLLTYFLQGHIYQKKAIIVFLNFTTSEIFLQNGFSLYFDQVIHTYLL